MSPRRGTWLAVAAVASALAAPACVKPHDARCDTCIPAPCSRQVEELPRAPATDPQRWLLPEELRPCPEQLDDAGRYRGVDCRDDDGDLLRFSVVEYDDTGLAVRLELHMLGERGGPTFEYLFDHDARGRIDTATSNVDGPSSIMFGYDDADRVVRVTQGNSGSGSVVTFSYFDDSGSPAAEEDVRRDVEGTTTKTTRTWAEDGRPITLARFGPDDGPLLVELHEEYDDDGRRVRRVRDLVGDGEVDEVQTFRYGQDGSVVAVDVDVAPLGSVDEVVTISERCCADSCAER